MTSRPNPKAFMYLALGTVVVGGGLCYFQYTKLGDVKARVAKLKTEVSDPNAVKSRLDQSNQQLAVAEQSLKHLEANVSSAAYVPSLLKDLDDYGKQNGISVTGVRPDPKRPNAVEAKAKAPKPYDELNIQVTGTGSFESIENFVTNLTTFPKIVAARMVSIEPARGMGADPKAATLNMTVDLKAYVFKPDGSSQAPAVPAATTAGTQATPAAGVGNTGGPTPPNPASGPAPTPAVQGPGVKATTASVKGKGGSN